MPNPRDAFSEGRRGHGRAPASSSSRRRARNADAEVSAQTYGRGLRIRRGVLEVESARGIGRPLPATASLADLIADYNRLKAALLDSGQAER